MRTGIRIASVALLGAALVYLVVHFAKSTEPAPLAAAGPAAAAEGEEQLSAELSAPEPRVAVEGSGLEKAAPVADVPVDPDWHPEDSLIPIEKLQLAQNATAAEIDLLHPAGSEFFKNKYAGRGAKQRLVAIDRLSAITSAHEAGTGEQYGELNEDQLQAIRAEIDWLKSNRGS